MNAPLKESNMLTQVESSMWVCIHSFDPVVTDYVPAEQLLKEGFHGSLDFEYVECDSQTILKKRDVS
jgi:hypothetical protein